MGERRQDLGPLTEGQDSSFTIAPQSQEVLIEARPDMVFGSALEQAGLQGRPSGRLPDGPLFTVRPFMGYQAY